MNFPDIDLSGVDNDALRELVNKCKSKLSTDSFSFVCLDLSTVGTPLRDAFDESIRDLAPEGYEVLHTVLCESSGIIGSMAIHAMIAGDETAKEIIGGALGGASFESIATNDLSEEDLVAIEHEFWYDVGCTSTPEDDSHVSQWVKLLTGFETLHTWRKRWIELILEQAEDELRQK